MSCFLCGKYSGEEIGHEESETHKFNEYNSNLEKRTIKKTLSTDAQFELENEIMRVREYYETHDNYECGNSTSDICCEFEGSREEVIRHEQQCIGFHKSATSVIDLPKTLKSKETATCDMCGIIYEHTGLLLPKYRLNRHIKVCEKHFKKNYKKFLLNSVETHDITQMKDIMNFINKIES